MPDDLPFHSLTELSRLLANGSASSREIVGACLRRVDALDSRLHAFVDVWRDEALAMADRADRERRAAGPSASPLAGLPIALKDLLHVAGRQTTAGSKSWRGRVSERTATAAARLLAAGMIPLGKTHMVEFAFGGWGRNEPMGAPWNPWDPDTHRVAGGSSSGSAVAVAAGLCPAAIGSDTGGSIRIPAALCGVTGLKPTYGLVSLDGVVPLATTLDSIGPIARDVDDAALLAAVMAGPDPNDLATLGSPQVDLGAALAGAPDVRGLALTALAPEAVHAVAEPDVARAYGDACATLRSLGARVAVERLPFDFEDLMIRNGRIIAAEAYAVHRAYIEDGRLEIDPWVRRRVLGGKGIGAADYIDDIAAHRQARIRFAEWMRGRDALVTPTLPIVATPLEAVDEASTPLATWTRAANYLGACALSLPAGCSQRGLPIGVQIVCAPFAEATLVRIGRAFQRATDWHRKRPPQA